MENLKINTNYSSTFYDNKSSISQCESCPKNINCCTRSDNIVVFPYEREIIISNTGREDCFKLDVESGLFLINHENGSPCPFLTSDFRCGIYELRPLDCKTWPITLDIKTKSYVADTACPAYQEGLSDSFLLNAKKMLEGIHPDYIKAFSELAVAGFNLLSISKIKKD